MYQLLGCISGLPPTTGALRSPMTSNGLPSSALAPPYNLVGLPPVSPQSLSTSLLQRSLAMQYQQHFPAGFLGNSSPIPTTAPSVSSAAPWPPFYFLSRGQQCSSLPENDLSPPMTSSRGPSLQNSPNSPSQGPKDVLMNSSIESLRMRARQHSKSMGFYE